MKKPVVIISAVAAVAVVIGAVVVIKKNQYKPPTVSQTTKPELPINTIPVEERPFITLTPDSSGHNLELSIQGVTSDKPLEYELLYNTVDSQEGALGELNVSSGTGPFTKEILLGTRSAGGATTYHKGVSGGSFDVTYYPADHAEGLRLKEEFNFLHYDPTQTSSDFTSVDGKFKVTLGAKALDKDAVVVVTQSFGLPAKFSGKVAEGPYIYTTAGAIKGKVMLSLHVPSNSTNPQVYGFAKGAWAKLTTKKVGDNFTFDPSGATVFIVSTE